MSLLEVKGLSLSFQFQRKSIPVVSDVSFELRRGETLGLVGESGCGKSVSALSLTRLLPSPPAFVDRGEVSFEDRDLLQMSERELRKIRGAKISMIFQEPMTALNPVFTVGDQIAEVVQVHEKASKHEARARAVEMMKQVGIPAAEHRLQSFPHQLSGGMRQRIMIAMALVCHPSVLIADEPTTALDVTIQAQILDLMQSLQQTYNMGVLLITHDLGVVAEAAERVAVMYAGEIVETTDTSGIFASPRHPYTIALQESLPDRKSSTSGGRLRVIEGRVPPPELVPSYCRFYDRCAQASQDCKAEHPPLREIAPDHWVRCIKA